LVLTQIAPEVDPALTAREAGAVRTLAAEFAMATLTPPAGASWLSVAVQIVVEPESRLPEAHWNALTLRVEAAAKLMAADWVLPFSVAVRVAVWLVVKAVAVAWKVAVAEFAGTTTVGGTVRFALLEARVTVAPPAPLTPRVQVVEPEGDTVVGLQVRLERPVGDAGGVIVPPIPVTVTGLPSAVDPTVPDTPIARLVTLGAMTTFAVATGPSGIVVRFIP